LRWWRLHPPRRNEDGTPAEPEPQEIAGLLADTDALIEHRRRLFGHLLVDAVAV
jgi:hypothetical protein